MSRFTTDKFKFDNLSQENITEVKNVTIPDGAK